MLWCWKLHHSIMWHSTDKMKLDLQLQETQFIKLPLPELCTHKHAQLALLVCLLITEFK